MTISLTITDLQDEQEFVIFEAPITLEPVINMTDITTIDNNVSTYITGSPKKLYTFNLGYLDAETFGVLKGFYDRQITNLKYPQITVEGADNLNIENMTARMILGEQAVIDNCGNVENVTVQFRESKQML